MAATSEERMAEEGGGGHGDSGSSSAIGSAQRLPPPPPPQPLQSGAQGPPAPTLAPDQLPQNNTLVALPIVAIENILSFMSYDEISQLRLVRPSWDPRRPVRRAEVWGGPEREARSPGREPPAIPAGARARSARPSRPKVSLGACQRDLSRFRPCFELGRLPGETSLRGAPCPPPGSVAAGEEGGSGSWASHLRPAWTWTLEGACLLPFVLPSSPRQGWGRKLPRGRNDPTIPGRFDLCARITYCSPNHPSFLAGENKAGLMVSSP